MKINDVFDMLLESVRKFGTLSALSETKARSDSFGSLIAELEIKELGMPPRKGGKRKHFKKKYSRKRIKR